MDEHKKRILQEIFLAGVQAADPEQLVHERVRRTGALLQVADLSFSLDRFERIVLLGAGKGTALMARALEDILGEDLTEGWIVVKYGHGVPLKKTHVREAAHPLPDEAGLAAAETLLHRLEACGEHDLVLCAFSGGGSALLPVPRPPITLSEKQEATRCLLACGATIDELNAVRKHLSLSKGGGLARAAHPATVVSLFLSDVVGDRLDVIASGPTVPDPTTFADCMAIVERYSLAACLPQAVVSLLRDGTQGLLPETPKPGDPVFRSVANVIVGNNRSALLSAARLAASYGYRTLVLTSALQGEAREVAQVFGAIAKEIRESGHPIPPPAAILAGGETTVTLRGAGKGGRNQEMALAVALALEGVPRIAFLSAGTDGTDGPTDAAGAVVTGETCRDGCRLGLDPRDFLSRNDAYAFLEQTGALVKTGPTRTNVMDIVCLLVA